MSFRGDRSVVDYLLRFFTPALIGNTIGGAIFVASLAHAQHAPSE